MPQFPNVEDVYNNGLFFLDLLWGLNELIYKGPLDRAWPTVSIIKSIVSIYLLLSLNKMYLRTYIFKVIYI